MVNMQALKSGKIKTNEDAYDTGIGTQFSAETNKRDEDEEMMKYIDEKISKKQGGDDDKPDEDGPSKYMSPEEAALLALPSHLRQSSAIKSEEMLSNQMLSGIPEIDLGIEAKIKNIEATEEAKQKLLWEQKNKKDGPSIMVPVNMAVNFVQHNRCKLTNGLEFDGIFEFLSLMSVNVEEEPKRKKFVRHEHPTNKDNKNPKKATDDYHYDKFKKQFRRH
jgi:Hepatocellular carcinoma-associated antigen 59